MAKSRLKMLPLNLLALIGLMALGASASAASPSEGESAPSPSPPSADAELICHTDNPAECYPKLFQATDEFQIVHPDQDLPLGLHVRLNVNTGLKEAKINVPDEHDPALEGLPVDSSVVVVDRDEAEEQIRLPRNAPAYDAVGKIKEPKSAKSGEGSAFYKSLTILKKGLDVDGALEMLEDISHDIYYGLKIAEDYDTVNELFRLAAARPPPLATAESKEQTANRARLAALTLASTVQNNPKALAEIEAHWPKISPLSGHGVSTTHTLGVATFTLFPPTPEEQEEREEPSAALTKARISLLAGLLKSPLFRAAFLAPFPPSDLDGDRDSASSRASGASHILRVLTSPQTSTGAWHATQRRAAQLLTDTFLDADMGAALGQWPTKAPLSDGECASLASEKGNGDGREEEEEECLDWHVAKLRKQFQREGDHWSHELGRKIAEARKATAEKKKKKKKDAGQRTGEKVDL